MLRYRLFLLLVPVAFLWSWEPVPAAAATPTEPVPQMTVSGEAVLKVPADRFQLSIGVATEAAAVEEALLKNTARIESVEAALKKAGLPREDIRTGRFQVQPQWSSPPRQPAPDWRPQIIGYSVTNTLEITTRRLDLAGRLIAAAAEAGANDIGSLVFDLADPRRFRAEAIKAAVANARADAKAMAEAASVRLVRNLTLTLDQAMAEPVGVPVPRMMKMEAASMADVPITPGEIPVRASVVMTWEIAPLQP